MTNPRRFFTTAVLLTAFFFGLGFGVRAFGQEQPHIEPQPPVADFAFCFYQQLDDAGNPVDDTIYCLSMQNPDCSNCPSSRTVIMDGVEISVTFTGDCGMCFKIP
jgi:hypothetical protein